jgi:cell division protein FtsN
VALLGFIGILLYVKQAPAPESMVPVKPEPKVEQPSLPKPPKEKWSYMTDLKTKQVEEGHYEVNTEGPYKMQCGSFKTQNQAEILKAKIAFVGIEAKISKSQGQNGLWYKVVLGPYAKKRLAESDKHKLKSNDVNGCQIWLWQ